MASSKISVVVTARFKDKRNKNVVREIGEVIEVTDKRLAEIMKAGDFVKKLQEINEEELQDKAEE